MNEQRKKKISKRLSFVLRHEPHSVGLTLDDGGWTPVDELLNALSRHGLSLTVEQLEEIVATNDKQRFAFSDDGASIRANQGHSVEVELGYEAANPPERLYHGTVAKFLDSIAARGLDKGRRSHVHLSVDRETAAAVGQRRGKPVILEIRSGEMHRNGALFFLTPNQVWLTDQVLPAYIDFPG